MFTYAFIEWRLIFLLNKQTRGVVAALGGEESAEEMKKLAWDVKME